MSESANPIGPRERIESAEVVLPARPFNETLSFFTDGLGFRVAAIFPADHPACAVVLGHGLRLRLQGDAQTPPGKLRLACQELDAPRTLQAPNGTRIELVPARSRIELPPVRSELSVARQSAADWIVGRADMRYRDLLPGRQGGRFGASHIRIESGGRVPDYVHFHRVRFQLIYCYRGWARLVYEDQGPEFVMRAGDCVLQPPEIRHRVLESSPGLEVVELDSPAEHETLADHELELPTKDHDLDRLFGGQRFLHHVAAKATWARSTSDPDAGFESRALGLAGATEGLLEAHVLRCAQRVSQAPTTHPHELHFRFVLEGQVRLELEGEEALDLARGDAVSVPCERTYSLTAAPGTELLEVVVPRA